MIAVPVLQYESICAYFSHPFGEGHFYYGKFLNAKYLILYNKKYILYLKTFYNGSVSHQNGEGSMHKKTLHYKKGKEHNSYMYFGILD